MNCRPLLIVLGEPRSVFIELFLKSFKILSKKTKRPLILIGSRKLVEEQIKYFKYKIKIREILNENINIVKNNKFINIININLSFKKPFEKSFKGSNLYIKNSFDVAIKILKKNKADGLINGPISKKKFLKKIYAGITEYLATKTNSRDVSMLIYNKNLSVSPITTHLPLKKVTKSISKKIIIKKTIQLNNFYREFFNIRPKIAILGLNPHCETTDKFSEEKRIIKPALKYLIKKNINIKGPFPADTFFLSSNYKKFNLVVGMYHDQVLTPIKTLFEFDAINITVGLPFIRVSPDHGPNESMISKGLSKPKSLIQSILFFETNL